MKNPRTKCPKCHLILAAALAGTIFSLQAHAQSGPARGPMPFSAYDQNGDGSISAEEFAAARAQGKAEGRPMRNAPSFAELDKNQDGKLSADEFAARQRGPGGRGPGAGQGRGPGAGKGAGPGAMPSFADFDLNKDGKITEEEFTEARSARISQRATEGYQMRGLANAPAFADMDTNHDRALEPGEFAAAQAQHRQQMRQ